MSTVMEDFQADFSNALADAFSASDSAVLNQLAPHYATLAKAYAIAAGREAEVTEEELDAAADEVARIVNSDKNLVVALRVFDLYPQAMTLSGATGALDLASLVDIYAQSLILIAQDPKQFQGEAVNFVTAVAYAMQNTPVSGDIVDIPSFFQAVTDVVLFKVPDLPEEETTSEESAPTPDGMAV